MPDWMTMTKEERARFIAEARESYHRDQYEAACAMFPGEDRPSWDALTDEQRENIRTENRRYQQEMQDFGASLQKS